jgi:ElaA protein
METSLTYRLKTFDQLSKQELYDIMALRQEVFIVEQDCPYLDADGKDIPAHHLMGYKGAELLCYTRLLDKGISYEKYSSIGRVVNSPKIRGKGEGLPLMIKSIEACKKLFPSTDIKISAQCYLQGFYEKLGFVSNGDFYLEDDIPHMGMVLEV